jgi:hypothetical protein
MQLPGVARCKPPCPVVLEHRAENPDLAAYRAR